MSNGNGNISGRRRRGRPLPTAPDLDALPLPPPVDAPLDDGVEVDEDVGYLYRKTSVAQALADALSEVAQRGDVPLEVLAGTMEAFDRVRACESFTCMYPSPSIHPVRLDHVIPMGSNPPNPCLTNTGHPAVDGAVQAPGPPRKGRGTFGRCLRACVRRV